MNRRSARNRHRPIARRADDDVAVIAPSLDRIEPRAEPAPPLIARPPGRRPTMMTAALLAMAALGGR